MVTHVSIQGNCVLRDTIEFNNKNGEIVVDKFAQFINPITMFMEKPSIKEDFFGGKFAGTEFSKRCCHIDFQKNLFEWLGTSRSDYFLCDVGSLVMHYFKFNNAMAFTESRFFLENKDLFLQELQISEEELKKYSYTIFDISVNELWECMREYAKKVLELYDLPQIVLVELYMAEKFVIPETMEPVLWWNNMTPTYLQNCVLREGFLILKNLWKGCNVIDWPGNVYGNVNHKWGKYQMHFTDDYYEWLYSRLLRIFGG